MVVAAARLVAAFLVEMFQPQQELVVQRRIGRQLVAQAAAREVLVATEVLARSN